MKALLKGFETLVYALVGLKRPYDPRVTRILNRSDADAIRSDWKAVGGYLKGAMEKYERENHRRNPLS